MSKIPKGPRFKAGDKVYKTNINFTVSYRKSPTDYFNTKRGKIIKYVPKKNRLGRTSHYYLVLFNNESSPTLIGQQTLHLLPRTPAVPLPVP